MDKGMEDMQFYDFFLKIHFLGGSSLNSISIRINKFIYGTFGPYGDKKY